MIFISVNFFANFFEILIDKIWYIIVILFFFIGIFMLLGKFL